MLFSVYKVIKVFCVALLLSAPQFGNSNAPICPLERAVGGLLFVPLSGTQLTQEERTLLHRIRPGGIVLYQWNVQSAAQLQQLLDDVSACLDGHRPIICADLEGGMVFRLKQIMPTPPAPRAVAKSSLCRAEDLAYHTAAIARQLGIDLILGPDLDVASVDCPVGNVRTFGSDPDVVAAFGLATMRGYQRAGIAYSPKHFPGHGRAKQDSHLEAASVTGSLMEWQHHDLPPFLVNIAEIPALMSAHLFNQALDAAAMATHSSKVVQTARDYGFKGVFITDSLSMDGAHYTGGSATEGVLRAYQAGHDVLLFGGSRLMTDSLHEYHTQLMAAYDALRHAVINGQISKQRLESSLAAIGTLLPRTPAALGDPAELQRVINSVVDSSLRVVKPCANTPSVKHTVIVAPKLLRCELEAVMGSSSQSPAAICYCDDAAEMLWDDLPAVSDMVLLSLRAIDQRLASAAIDRGLGLHVIHLGVPQQDDPSFTNMDSYLEAFSPDQTSIRRAMKIIFHAFP